MNFESFRKKIISKYVFGHGGIKCSCCRIGSKKEARTQANRHDRRTIKMILNHATKIRKIGYGY